MLVWGRTYSRRHPEQPQEPACDSICMRNRSRTRAVWGGAPFLVPVNQSWKDGTEVGARAYHEEDNEEEGLKVEQG